MKLPYVSVANLRAETMLPYASEFGFTPASRSKIHAPQDSDDEPDLFGNRLLPATFTETLCC